MYTQATLNGFGRLQIYITIKITEWEAVNLRRNWGEGGVEMGEEEVEMM